MTTNWLCMNVFVCMYCAVSLSSAIFAKIHFVHIEAIAIFRRCLQNYSLRQLVWRVRTLSLSLALFPSPSLIVATFARTQHTDVQCVNCECVAVSSLSLAAERVVHARYVVRVRACVYCVLSLHCKIFVYKMCASVLCVSLTHSVSVHLCMYIFVSAIFALSRRCRNKFYTHTNMPNCQCVCNFVWFSRHSKRYFVQSWKNSH